MNKNIAKTIIIMRLFSDLHVQFCNKHDNKKALKISVKNYITAFDYIRFFITTPISNRLS